MAKTDKPRDAGVHADVVMVEVPAQLIAALHQAVSHATGETPPGVAIEADTPAEAIAMLYQVASQSAGLSLQNAVHSQQVLNQISTAVVSKAVALITGVGHHGTAMVAEVAAPPNALGEAPAMLMGAVYQSMAHSTGILFENAVAAQQQNTLAQAAANQGVMQIYSLDTAAGAGATEKPARLHDDTD